MKSESIKDFFVKYRILLIIVAGIVFIAIAATIAYCVYFVNRWYPGTIVSGIDISGMEFEESSQFVLNKYKNYQLTIEGRDGANLSIKDSQLDYNVNLSNDWENLFKKQHQNSFFPINQMVSSDLPLLINYNKEKLNDILKNSEMVKGSDDYKIKEPESAVAIYNKAKGYFWCKKEKLGNTIIFEEFEKEVQSVLETCQNTMDIKDTAKYPNIYKKPKLTSSDSKLKNKVEKYNQTILRFINIKLKNKTVKISPKQIAKWISYKNDKIKYNYKKIQKWVEKFCLKYKTVGSTRVLKAHNKKKVKVVGGDYGWQIDYEKMLKDVKKNLKKKISKSYIDAYIENPTSKNKKKLTINQKLSYLGTAYKWNEDDKTKDWDEKNYVEVSLADQKVYIYRKGKLKFSCRCISGRPVPGRKTRTGTYYIKEHLPSHTMVGADYRTFVYWWVRITWTGTGFHPANWQPWSRWSKTLYLSRGSHGCLNLAPSDAVTVYKLTRHGEAVFIH